MDFEQFWDLYNPEPNFNNRKAATQLEWFKCTPEKREAIIEWLQKNRPPQGRNPYFFVQDFILRVPRPQILSFDEYYARYGTTEEKDGWTKKFLPEERKTIYVKPA